MRSGLVDLDVLIHVETVGAALVSDTGDSDDAVWLPKSQIDIGDSDDGRVTRVTLPEWLAKKKRLI